MIASTSAQTHKTNTAVLRHPHTSQQMPCKTSKNKQQQQTHKKAKPLVKVELLVGWCAMQPPYTQTTWPGNGESGCHIETSCALSRPSITAKSWMSNHMALATSLAGQDDAKANNSRHQSWDKDSSTLVHHSPAWHQALPLCLHMSAIRQLLSGGARPAAGPH